MTIKQFIEKAIEGGWKGEGAKFNAYEETFHDVLWYLADGYAENCSLEEMLLDPLAWSTVGKAEIENWGQIEFVNRERGHETSQFAWRGRMHRFIDGLCDGKDLSVALDEATK